MKRVLAPLAAIAVLVLLATPALGVIEKVVDKDGKLRHYKYTDRKGNASFAGSLASIPPEIVAGNEIVRIDPPLKPEPPAAGQAAEQAGEGEAPGSPSLSEAPQPVSPAAAPPQEPGGDSRLLTVLGVVVLAGAGGVAYKLLAARRQETQRTAAASPYRGRERPEGARAAPERSEAPAGSEASPVPPHNACGVAETQPSGAVAPGRDETSHEAIERLIQAGDYAGAAQICDAQGEIARGAELYVKAGLYAEAAVNYEQVGDFSRAGESHLKAGDPDRALAALQQLDGDAPEYQQASLLVGRIFLKRGMIPLAREKFTKIIAGRPIQRATLEPYYYLALCHERAGEPQQARAIFEKILAEDHGFRDVKARLAAR